MTWARLDDEVLDHPKVARAGVLGWALFTAGIVYCARNLTDGHIPRARLSSLLDLSGVAVLRGNTGGEPVREEGALAAAIETPHPQDLADHLVAIGLWEEAPEGYVIHDYLDYNPTRSEVLKKRASTRKRVARHRAKKDVKRVSNAVSNAVSNGPVTQHPVPVPPLQGKEGGSSNVSSLSEVSLLRAVVGRFEEISTKQQRVDAAALQRVLADFSDLPCLRDEGLACAEWFATSKRRDAARTLRNWLSKIPKEAPRERRYTRFSNA